MSHYRTTTPHRVAHGAHLALKPADHTPHLAPERRPVLPDTPLVLRLERLKHDSQEKTYADVLA